MTDQPEKPQEPAVPRIQTLEPPQLLPKRLPTWAAFAIPVSIVALVFLAGGDFADAILIFSVIIGMCAIVMVHEGGHFLAGKLCGMKITEFFVGFGSRIWSFKRGETEYGIKAIPAGGYVKIIGMTNIEEVDPQDEPRTYRAQPFYERAFVTFAGILAQFALAFVLLLGAVLIFGIPDKAVMEVGSLTNLKSGQTPAQKAGFKEGDRIVSVDGAKPKDWNAFVKYVQARPNVSMLVTVERNKQLLELNTIPADYATLNGNTEKAAGEKLPKNLHYGFIGISPALSYKDVGIAQAPVESAKDLWRRTGVFISATAKVITGVGNLYNAVVNDPKADDNLRPASPVAVTRYAGQAASDGALHVLMLVINLNIVIAIFNLVPLLPLDGGHVAIALYEAVRSRKGKRHVADIRKIAPFAYAFAAYLLIFSAAGLYLDIFRGVPGLDR